ncbi:hypothetical protein DPSP01_008183 [Paraphaeosphaeria sporulosa]|uniref:C2H2-type domain-containing protein n=1 Tax=Paraphaeosphaeria sporulosa TaxID=1460663 RepID=A0A177C7F1_9PLEO|nr:uncharacterized protein CC84DRAFT_1207548 [Paraphaeosphaeria sporulosa]OAG02677.1 hypothetical protein CC84DRAFT_1207548 [Paraphaeosphaeria sporulosa]
MKRTYTCRHCARVFKRSEHCARHERVHTQEKPFSCAYCDRKYARKDLVKRHERTLHAEQYRKAHPEEFGSGSRLSEGSESPRTPHPLPPLTPPDEYTLNRDATYTPVVDMHNADPELSYVPSAPFRSSSGSSSSDGGRPLPPGDESINFDFPPMNLDFHQAPVPGPRAAFPLHVETNFYQEPPTKRQRIEIDPLIVGTRGNSDMHVVETPISQLGVQYNAIDPNLEDPHFAPSSLPHGSPTWEDLEQTDLSAEYLALFDMETEQNNRTDMNTQSSHERVRVHSEPCANLRNLYNLQFTEEIHRRICDDIRMRVTGLGLPETLLPTLMDLQQFFSGYLEGFHRHFPIIHLHSFDPYQVPSPLITAMCSIGAQYRLRREKAKNLFVLAGTMSSHALHNGLPIVNGNPEPGPLWVMQTRVLLSLSGMFSGMTSVVLRTVENLGIFTIDYRLRKALLKRSNAGGLDWDEWVYRESSKRLLFGMYVVSNLISTTFGVISGFSHTDDLEFEDLEEERFWNATSAQEWLHLRQLGPATSRSRSTVRSTLSRILLDKDHVTGGPPEVSVLTMLLLMHGMNIHIEGIRQVIELSPAHLHKTLLDPTIATLSACEDILAAARQRKDTSTPWTEAEGPLMFNCQGVVHMAHVRLFLDMSAFNRLMLINDNPDEIAAAAYSFAEAPLQRSEALTGFMKKSYDRHHVLVKLGHSLLRKTAALSWSLEHAVTDWVGILLVTKWIHTVETSPSSPPDADENELLGGYKHLLAETDCEYNGDSLASAVAHFRSTMLNDVWVWGVTPRMSVVLQHLACVYEDRHRALKGTNPGFGLM